MVPSASFWNRLASSQQILANKERYFCLSSLHRQQKLALAWIQMMLPYCLDEVLTAQSLPLFQFTRPFIEIEGSLSFRAHDQGVLCIFQEEDELLEGHSFQVQLHSYVLRHHIASGSINFDFHL